MKLALWRYSLAVQVGADSKAGGGRITEAVLLALKKLGHHVTVLGKLAPGAKQWLSRNGFDFALDVEHPSIAPSMESFEGALVLTGPTNMLYDGRGLVANYARLCALGLDKPVAYAQWDPALPFMFRPELNSGFAKQSGLRWNDVSGLRWTLLSQQREEVLRSTRNKASAYATTPFRHERCLFESCELDQGEELKPTASFEPKIGYFGSDRPGRIAELKRWSETGVPIVVHGKWSAASKAKLPPHVEFRDPVPEQDVRHRLNQFAATLHLADAAYVKGDFVSQRFFENAMAGVPTFYSDQIQPSIAPYVRDFVIDDFMKPLPQLFRWACSAPYEERAVIVKEHRTAVRAFAARCSYKLEAALGRTFS